MPKKDRTPKARSSGDKWFVYIVRCAGGSMYTGITKDVTRRCQQLNAGTASRYTRSRRPVKLIYQEVRPDQSSALKRELAIKAMNRRGKLTMIQKRKKLANKVREIAQLEDIPNIGPAVAADLRQLGITSPGDLPGRENRPNSLDQYRSVNVGKMPFFVTIGIVEMFTSDTVAVGDSTTIM